MDASELDFGTFVLGRDPSPRASVVVTNDCSDDVRILSQILESPEGFFVVDRISADLSPGDAVALEVTLEPVVAGTFEAALLVEGTIAVQGGLVRLFGTAEPWDPVLELDPVTIEFGGRDQDCPNTLELDVHNTGTAALVVDGVEMLPQADELVVADSEGADDWLPFVVQPGQTHTLAVTYTPSDVTDDSAYVHLHSNDPLRPDALVAVTGNGLPRETAEDAFIVDLSKARADILLTVDRSSTMRSELTRLETAVPAFLSSLSDVGLDWRLAAVVDDSGCVVGERLYVHDGDTLANATTALVQSIDADLELSSDAVDTRHGFALAYRALDASDPVECNAGLVRPTTPLHNVHVSDSDDASDETWAWYEAAIVNRGEARDPTVHAVAPPEPSGCGTSAAAVRYADAVQSTGGQFESSCATDYAAPLSRIAAAIATPWVTFELSEIPAPQTVRVWADGTPLDPARWEVEDRTVRLTHGVGDLDGAALLVTYEVQPECTGSG